MRLTVSNIAWTADEEPEVAKALQEMGVKYIEIAPTKVWDDPLNVTDQQIADYLTFWQDHGITVVAFQSMLFPRPDLKIFESTENRAKTTDYLKKFITLAGKMKAGVMVFGSPKNRQRGEIPLEEANEIAVDFFNDLGNEAQKHNVRFCIEPNAPQYACDFITNAQGGIDLVTKVNNPGLGLHLDIACMALAGDGVAESIKNGKTLMQHFHISSPMLDQVKARDDIPHSVAAQTLKDINYNGYASIEMRPGEPGTNVERVTKAIEFAKTIYG